MSSALGQTAKRFCYFDHWVENPISEGESVVPLNVRVVLPKPFTDDDIQYIIHYFGE
jgi:hypothetical protein